MSNQNYKVYKNVFQKLNQDLAKNKYTPEIYYDASNVRIIAHTEQSTQAVSNIKGEEIRFVIPEVILDSSNADGTFTYSYQINLQTFFYQTRKNLGNLGTPANRLTNPKVIGYSVAREKIIFFVAYSISQTPTVSPGTIWEYNTTTNQLRLKYFEILNFSTAYPIEALSFYQNSNVIKTYWVNGYHQLRHINTEQPDLSNLPLDFIDIAPELILTQPKITNVSYPGGSFKAGRVAYAFSYVNKYGVQTKVSSVSPLYNINAINTGNLTEDDIDVSFQIEIDNLRQDFDFIRVYRLFFSLSLADPIITLIKEEAITSSQYTFIDDNTELIAPVSLAEFLLLGSDPFIPHTLDTKDNRLFTANHKYEYFDPILDTRVYRFGTGGSSARIFDKQGNFLLVISGPTNSIETNWNEVPEKHDCINPSVKAETNNNGAAFPPIADDDWYNTFIYQLNGTTIGAEGPNVKIGISQYAIPYQLDNGENLQWRIPSQPQSFLNPLRTELMNFKRDESYRLGLQFRNALGQWSFVKWMCDFRIPAPWEEGFRIIDANGNYLQLQLTVELKSGALTALQNQGVTAWRVVRIERDRINKTCVAQGMITPLRYTDTDSVIRRTHETNRLFSPKENDSNFSMTATDVDDKDIVEFRSSDLSYNNAPSGYLIAHSLIKVSANTYTSSDVSPNFSNSVITSSTLDSGNHQMLEISHAIEYGGTNFGGCLWNNPVRINPISNILLFNRNDGSQGILSSSFGSYTVSGEYVNSAWAGAGKDLHNSSNHLLAFLTEYPLQNQIENEIGTTVGADFSYLVVGDLKRTLPNQYGGDSYANRTRGKYVQTSDTVLLSQNTVTCYGDTVVTNMRYQRQESKFKNAFTDSKSAIQDFYFFPCELEVNEDLRLSSEFIVRKWDRKIEDFHRYNDIYSKTSLSQSPAFPKPLLYTPVEIYEAETRYSELKQNDEVFDSWTDFKEGNKNQVEGLYGPIIRLLVNGDNFYYFQHFGYGMWGVNPRVQVQGQDGVSLELGTGSVLNDYKYISTNIGCQHKWSISKSIYGVVFYDQLHNKLRMIDQSSKELNLVGINTFLQNLPEYRDNPAELDAIQSTFYQKTNETFISFTNVNGNTTWVFNHLTDGFTNKIPNNPLWYIPAVGNMYVFQNGVLPRTQELDVMDKGAHGFFNNTYHPSYVTIVIANDADFVKMLNNLSWNSEVYDNQGVELPLETISHIRIYNDYQDTGLLPVNIGALPLNNQNASRLLRVWRYTVPFINVIERLRSQYFFVTLYFENNNNKKIVLQDIVSHTTIQS